ncbi:MarR family transcriptional regulator [Streptomyces sp. N2-109]|uniref:MarR family transcriptional regulator n=1 Tax=Streptomyces gossypii TaxID=2883101 RepID=A0ABT2JN74_9ACTN|nr:MarR family transcriptional regulator [Streptomyces gossypii]MCT2589276.1 MarR family transcriptional regulator [Streptomyces gossypii]
MGPVESDDPLYGTELTFLLGLAFQLLLGEFNDRVAEAGYPDLRPVHGLAFQALGPAGATSSELAARLGVTKQAAGQIVDDLERRGYVRREAHPAGGRRKLVVLTEAAQAHLAVAGRLLHGLEAELATRLGAGGEAETGAAELGRLRTDLVRVIRALAGTELPPLRPVW